MLALAGGVLLGGLVLAECASPTTPASGGLPLGAVIRPTQAAALVATTPPPGETQAPTPTASLTPAADVTVVAPGATAPAPTTQPRSTAPADTHFAPPLPPRAVVASSPPPAATPAPSPTAAASDVPKYTDVAVLALAADARLPSGKTFRQCVELPPEGKPWPSPVHLYYAGRGKWLVETHLGEVGVVFDEATATFKTANFASLNPEC